ncbi:MAG: glucokinase, partial [Alphaproteobacteria bacterium]|nr:glucokinase [Alphaproteobacteria bacterium]
MNREDFMLNETILLSDVGGTNIRFALYRQGELSPIMNYRTESGKSYTNYIDEFLHDLGQKDNTWMRPSSAIIGAAGLIENGIVHSKNCPVKINQAEIKAWGFDSVDIENDFVTQSRSVKSSNVNDFIWSSDEAPSLDGSIMVIGPGTGLGMSVIRESHKGRMLPQAAEAGFTSVPLLDGASAEQNQTIEILRDYMRREHNSRLVYDQIVSGSGLVRLYYARRHVEYSKQCPQLVFTMPREPNGIEKTYPTKIKKKYGLRLTAQEICDMSQNGSRTAKRAVSYFLRYLGRFAAD